MKYDIAIFIYKGFIDVYEHFYDYTYLHIIGDKIIIKEDVYTITEVIFNPRMKNVTYKLKHL